jgi:hypothetical protein
MTTAIDMTDVIVEVVQQCLDRHGMRPPLIMCAISPNGSVIVCRFSENPEPQNLAEHFEGGGFALPMTLVVLDQRNDAVRVTLNAQGKKAWH